MKRTPYNSALERLNQYQPKHGLRPSAVRNNVLEQVCALPQPFSAAQLEEACKQQRISTGTVYNALKIFVSAQILHVIKRQRGQAVMEYELITSNTPHMQYVCEKCGRMVDFNDKAIARLVKERRYSNYDVRTFSLIVYGECKVCRVKQQKENEI